MKNFQTMNEKEFWAMRAKGYNNLEWANKGDYLHEFLNVGDFHEKDIVLDVGTGTGIIAHTVAPFVKRVVGVDISEEMLARARRLYDGVEFALGDAEELAFGDDAFDAAVAAFLLHHVPSPERVVAELARVARRVAVAQWDAAERARLIGLLTDAIAAAGVQPPTGQPVGPSRERLARDEELRRLFEGAGLADVRVDTVAFVEPMRGTDELWEGVLGGSVNTRATVLAQPPDVQQRIRDELVRLVDPYRRDDGIDVPVSVRIASGRRG